ncbi:MAG: ADP-ribosyltransferase [Hyphomonas sp.]|uniref:ADP-ribosyltransferase n=1 Tax=Hyphomonas sp. TaxID=87 RepID=UPI00329A3A66
MQDWLRDAVAWHEQRWASAVQAGAGIDVFPFINRAESMPQVRAFQRQITNLIRDIDNTARKDIEGAVWRGLTDHTPRKEIGKEIAERLGIQRRRANRIAVDQAQKLNGELTRIRMQEAGLTEYRWRHSGKVHFRPEHKARNDKVFKMGEPAGDQPGQAIYCGCVAMPVIDVENGAAEAAPEVVSAPPANQAEPKANTTKTSKVNKKTPPSVSEPNYESLTTRKRLTEQQKIEIKDYKEGNYRPLNQYLRNPSGVRKTLAKEYDQQVKTIDSAISKSTLNEDVTVYRGIKHKTLAQNAEQLVGKEISAAGFQSTSLSRRVAQDFVGFGDDAVIFEIRARKGLKAMRMDEFETANVAREKELLFSRGQKAKVTGVRKEGRATVIEMDYI